MSVNNDIEYFSDGHFGHTFHFARYHSVDTGNWPVISISAYERTLAALLTVTTIVGILRIGLRRHFNGRWDIDDALFTFALCCSFVSGVFTIYFSPYFYIEAEINIGSVAFVRFDEVVPAVIQYLQILNSVSAVEWIAIYSVKLCYLMFFNKLTSRLRGLRIWWWFVLCSSIPCLIVSCVIGLYLCHDFGPNILQTCPISDMNARGGTWNRVSGALDIVTDLMIISIPILLITKVKIDLRRKIVITTILSLSAAMIATAIIRLFPPTIHILTIDGPWYFFWVAFESSIAILMVSITSFKSIYGGQKRATSDKSPSPMGVLKASWSNASSRMGRFFLWSHNSKSIESISSSTEEPLTVGPNWSMEKKIAQGRYFNWGTRNSDYDAEKGHAGTDMVSLPSIAFSPTNSQNTDWTQVSASGDLVSLPSMAFSPMTNQNSGVSPESTEERRDPRDWHGRF